MGTSVFRLRYALGKIFNSTSKNLNSVSYNVSRTYLVSCFNLNKSFVYNSIQSTNFNGKVFCNTLQSKRNYCSNQKLNKDEISEKVLQICKTFDKIPVDKVTLESHFMNDLGLDSLDHVELIMNIEDDFNFEIPDADAEKLLRPKDIVEYIVQKELTTAE